MKSSTFNYFTTLYYNNLENGHLLIMINFLLSSTYIVGVETCCIGNSCPKVTSFNAQFDSGTSFTFLPGHAYGAIAEEVLLSFEFMIVNLFSGYLYDLFIYYSLTNK